MIHIKCQALFSLKNNIEKKIKRFRLSSATISFGNLRVYNMHLNYLHDMAHITCRRHGSGSAIEPEPFSSLAGL